MSNTQFRKLENGYLIAPRRGIVPIPPEGYEVAFGDPFVFLPKLDFCEYRERRIIKRACCGNTERLFCKGKDSYVTRVQCQECMHA